MIANGVIVQGTTGCGGGQLGGCFYSKHDVNAGEEIWPVHTIARGDTPEGNSWNGVPVEIRHGGLAWISGAYDVEQKLIFAGLAKPIDGTLGGLV